MKKILFCLLLIAGFTAQGQTYNNEWIDFTKTYYKFELSKTGLYRIPQSVLNSAGLGSATAESFQLWRNGVQVPIYTSVSSGVLSTNDFIEFWGEQNDGKPDKALYRNPDFQLNDRYSLQTNNAVYFLTVNTNGSNLRLTNTANNVSNNTLPAEPFFMHTVGRYYHEGGIGGGEAIYVGQYLYSSSYDVAEGWASRDLDSAQVLSHTYDNLFVHTSGPTATLRFNVAGNALHERRVGVRINGAVIDTMLHLNYYNYRKATYANIPASILSTNNAVVDFTNMSKGRFDRMRIAQHELTYPRQFNFGGETNFEFHLPAKSSNSFLQISGFSFGASVPVLYDLTNGKRYNGVVTAGNIVNIVLEPSATERRLVLVSQATDNINTINTALQSRRFIDYSKAASQGDYLIITNSLLINTGTGTNPIEDYRVYRNSPAGGGYNSKIYLIDELTDQFAFGIKKHPLAIRNFLLFARKSFAPKHAFLIGKGVNYVDHRYNEGNPNMDKLNLVPTFGWPASDVLFTADPGSSVPQLSIGRLSVINTNEVSVYLNKIKQFELAQRTSSPNKADKLWMKNFMHLNGLTELDLRKKVDIFYNKYKNIISDTMYGGNVITFSKDNADAVQNVSNEYLENLFKEGLSVITYFGHSSSNTLEFNLDNPAAYQNKGKYPLFIALGCQAGDIFHFNPTRFSADITLSEKYVLAPERGTIGFLASTHFGIPEYLDPWNTEFYRATSTTHYGATVGEMMVIAGQNVFQRSGNRDNYYDRTNMEQLSLNGDPAIRINPHPKPDYIVDDPSVRIAPDFISIADPFIKLKANFFNTGKAVDKDIVVEVKQEYPNGTIATVYKDTIPGIRYADSLSLNIPVNGLRSKGRNKIIVTIDALNEVDEIYESNNTVTKEVTIYEDELKPVYPQNFAIVNKKRIKLIASTANAFIESKTYRMELDTTALFNSALKITKNITSTGGVIEFDPGIDLSDSTVYYWRVAMVANGSNLNWGNASFIYLSQHKVGFNQSHFFQHTKSDANMLYKDSISQNWKFGKQLHSLFIRNTIFPTGGTQETEFTVSVDGDAFIRSACVGRSLIFNVFNERSFIPWRNVDSLGRNFNLYGSGSANCGLGRQNNFEFSYMSSVERKKIMDFMDIIPTGAFVVVRSFDHSNNNSYSATWRGDTAIYGANNSLYHKLLDAGFGTIDSVDKPRAWIFIYQKNNNAFKPKYILTEGVYDKVALTEDFLTSSSSGSIVSPLYGPAKKWEDLFWDGSSLESPSTDSASLDVIGVAANGTESVLFKKINITDKKFDVSAVDANKYPYIKLKLNSKDTIDFTPYQLKYWRLTYMPLPEGALAPNIYLKFKDTLDLNEPLDIKVAFKNVSETAFDSLKVKMVVTDANNVQHVLPVKKHKPLNTNDTLHVAYTLDTKSFMGINNLYVEVNPENENPQPEQYHFNNFGFKSFYVRPDSLNPLLDVTFDNVHILNNDIVSSKPDILVKLKDDSRWGLLDDTALIKLQVRYPSGRERLFYFNNDTLTFNPPQAGNVNEATINFKPYFEEDGLYTLSITGSDKSGNKTGNIGYKISYEVINKPMISNMLNYPNPFTTSTAFVFTLTGSHVPQELKIQVLTITGKVVREITKEELGPLRIGRNITEYKWDGTDQFGQKLANGVYLYRVVTSINGKTLEKYKSEKDETDKYFNKGYGKMYLMR